MPRPLRICEPDYTYHIMSRCIEAKNLMKSNKLKNMMIDVLNMAHEKYEYKFQIINFSILNNHFHFIIKTEKGGPTISQIMQFIKSQYARRYNKMMNRIGPFWNERFRDKIIELAEDPKYYFNNVCWYIAFNSTRKKYTNDPRDYKYCGINFFLDENYVPPVKLTHHKYFIDLGKTFEERVKNFLVYEERYRKRLFQDSFFV